MATRRSWLQAAISSPGWQIKEYLTFGYPSCGAQISQVTAAFEVFGKCGFLPFSHVQVWFLEKNVLCFCCMRTSKSQPGTTSQCKAGWITWIGRINHRVSPALRQVRSWRSSSLCSRAPVSSSMASAFGSQGKLLTLKQQVLIRRWWRWSDLLSETSSFMAPNWGTCPIQADWPWKWIRRCLAKGSFSMKLNNDFFCSSSPCVSHVSLGLSWPLRRCIAKAVNEVLRDASEPLGEAASNLSLAPLIEAG